MPETTLTSTSVFLFALYTLITIIGGTAAVILGRGRVSTMGEKAKNDAVATITNNFGGLLEDARNARMELNSEREKRAELRGEVNGLIRQIDKLNGDMDKLRRRLEQVEGEKRTLEAEKLSLEDTLDTRSKEYKALHDSIEKRITEAVERVRVDITKQYESRIAELDAQIQQRNEEIALLKKQLEEKSHEPQQNPIPTDSPSPAPDPQPPNPDSTGSDTGSATGTNPSSGSSTRS